jgi:hypothetical protein
MSNQITTLPPDITGANLVSALNERLRQINIALGGGSAAASSAAASISSGRHAMRLGQPLSGFPNGSIWIESDRSNIAYQVQNGAWFYTGGVLKAAFASAPAGLTASDAGLLWNVSDYAHLLRWTATGWEFVDAAGNYIQGCAAAPDGNGWQLCDGSATHYLHIAAGVASEAAFTTPNLIAVPQYPRWNSGYTGAVVGANAPGVITVGLGGSGTLVVKSVDATGQPAHVDLVPYYRR